MFFKIIEHGPYRITGRLNSGASAQGVSELGVRRPKSGKGDNRIILPKKYNTIISGWFRMGLKEKILAVIAGPHVSAVATISAGKPAVRFMVLSGSDDMTLIAGTMKASRKVEHLKKNPDVAISIWSGKEFTDPYVVIKAKGEVHEDLATKKKSWNPMFEKYFKTVDNPDYVILKFIASEIEYTTPDTGAMDVWKRN
jgi:Uncharacterized stress protein (general stress protein 26)